MSHKSGLQRSHRNLRKPKKDIREIKMLPSEPLATTEWKGNARPRPANVTAYNPVAVPIAKIIFKNKIHYATSAIECLKK